MSTGEGAPTPGADNSQTQEPPAPMLEGTFALYGLPDKGLMLVTDIPGRGEEKRIIPGKVLRMMTGGPAGRLLGKVFGGEVAGDAVV